MDNLATVSHLSKADYDQNLAEEITLLAGQINAANYRLLKLIATFDEREAWIGGGTIRSCAHWLNWKCGIALGPAREKVRVAHCLESLPLIDAAFAAGEISYSKVRAMTRSATPENEDFLLLIARHGTASHVEQVIRKYRSVTSANEDKAEIEQEQTRELVYYQDEDGSWVMHARLPAEAGSIVVKAIEAVATTEQDENVPAGTFLEEEEERPAAPRKTYGQARADALATMAEHFLATCDQNDQWQGLKGSERCQVVLHVGMGTLQNRCDLDGKHWISAKTAKRLSCDASLVAVLENDQGQVLNIGRRARTIPASIKRALDLRDKTCRVPGCCNTRYLDAHHIQHWADGGETSLDNLMNMCRHHHRQLHQGLFNIRVEKASAYEEAHRVFSTPDGKQLKASFFPQFSEKSVATAEQALSDAAPNVNSNTAVTQWAGENLEYPVAVEILLQRDEKRL